MIAGRLLMHAASAASRHVKTCSSVALMCILISLVSSLAGFVKVHLAPNKRDGRSHCIGLMRTKCPRNGEAGSWFSKGRGMAFVSRDARHVGAWKCGPGCSRGQSSKANAASVGHLDRGLPVDHMPPH